MLISRIFWSLFLFCSCFDLFGQQNENKPNIVFILADDLGWADLPTYGNRFNEAPNLERMAKEGLTFSNAYAANPVCSPTRASIQTGQYPARIGINDWIPGHWRPFENLLPPLNRVQQLPLSADTLGEMMKRAGYTTGYFGKWHLGQESKYLPANRGYDSSVTFQGAPYFEFGEKLIPEMSFPKDKTLSEALTDLSIDFIADNKKRPFFLFLSHFDVHVQLDAQGDLISKYLKKEKPKAYPGNAIYGAMVENLDISVGRIMDKLKDLGLEENTLVIFFSDNGGLVKRFDELPLISDRSSRIYQGDTLQYIATSNLPLRGEKGSLYEGGIRVPLMMKWPARIKPDQVSKELVSSVDFFPTLASVAGESTINKDVIDGISLDKYFDRSFPINEEDRSLYWHYPVYHHSVPGSAVRLGNYKLIHFYDQDRIELYDLNDDLSETENLAKIKPEKSKELLANLEQWRKNINASEPTANPNFDELRRHEWGKHPDSK